VVRRGQLVANQWVALYDGSGVHGDLEIAVAKVTARWRSRLVDLPDYYLVLDAGHMPATLRHWFLGVLHAAAPTRVVPVQPTTAAVDRALTNLPTGRWWPDLPELLTGIDQVAPDAVDTAPVSPAAATNVVLRSPTQRPSGR
jgi:hypothetical protein